jgi:uncharacterized protein (DUF1800 family)
MQRKRPTLAVFSLVAIAAALSVQFAIAKKKEKLAAAAQLDEHKRAVHALNRLTFGPRVGDVDRISAMGLDKWIDQQLHPEKIDDAALTARLEPLRTLKMETREMVENFPPQQLIKAVAEHREPLPSDAARRAIYEAQIERYYQKQEKKQADTSTPVAVTASQAAPNVENKTTAADDDEAMARKRENRLYADLDAGNLLSMPPDERVKTILRMSPESQIALGDSLKGNQREKLLDGLTPQQRETVIALNNPQQVVNEELVQGKLLRSIYSERQLQEVMTDFWFNHFNVFIGKGADRYMLTSYERDVIRPHAFGKFEDLLVATAESPAMLFYLDNWLSVGPNSQLALGIPTHPAMVYGRRRRFPPPQRPVARKAKAKHEGLNENYGRELMELHTLGVNGGYTQKDVTEVARVFTGWTLKEPRQGGGFFFDERKHDPGDKVVLGHRIKYRGEKEGREVLHLLAHHPATAKFVCTKLAVRFVSDDPPPALVDRMAKAFLKKDGDIREVLRTMLESPEFWAPDAYRAKLKTPLEFVLSAARASGAEVTDAMPLARQLQNMGMPLYGAQPPTGYSMKADAWVNSSALLGRMNFALALTGGKMKNVQPTIASALPAESSAPDPQGTLAKLEALLLASDVSQQTHEVIEKQLQDPKGAQEKAGVPLRSPDVGLIAGLLLGSPEFQRR